MNQVSRQALANFKTAYDEWQEELKAQKIPMREGEETIWEITNERFPGGHLNRSAGQ